MTWTQTHTGCAVDLLNPRADTIRAHDLAVAQSRIVRFNGHTLPDLQPYVVAHHAHLVESLMPEGTPPVVRLAALLHDAHEAYVGDLITPLVQAMAALSPSVPVLVDQIKFRLQDAIETAVGMPLDVRLDHHDAIHFADMLALAAEKRDLMGPEPQPWVDQPDPSGVPRIDPLGHWSASYVWKSRLKMLVREAGVTPMREFDLW